MARAHVQVSGVVQGVFFRYHAQEMARQVGVAGWIRNTPEGKVEAIFEGKREDVEKMVEFCRTGPPGAKVTGVKVDWEDYRGEFSGFEVRYR